MAEHPGSRLRKRRLSRAGAAILSLAALIGPAATAAEKPPPTFDIKGFGAVGDGKADDWWAFQQAIDAASERGGGVVLAPRPGAFWRISHALRLYSVNRLRTLTPGSASKADPFGAWARFWR